MELVLNLMVLFISTSILLFLGTQILGAESLGDCSFGDSDFDTKAKAESATKTGAAWSAECYDIQETTIDAYGLFGVVLIVISAIAILALVRMM